MVSVERYERAGKWYYRLVHTFRNGKKIVHKRKYLGIAVPPPARLERLKKEFLSELSGKKFRYFTQKDVEDIELKKIVCINEQKKLSSVEEGKKLKEFIIRFTYDSNKLSGLDITLRQTSLILREGIIPQDIKSIKIVKTLENHEKGVLVITTYRGSFHLQFIKKLHKVLLSGVADEIAGKTRDELKRNVKLAGTSYVPPSWHVLRKELMHFFQWFKSEQKKLHPVELAALVHLKLITLQPFVDGNSRLSRLLMNWVLWKKKYPFVDIPIDDLERYYKVLDLYQIEGKEKPFVDYIKERYLKSDW